MHVKIRCDRNGWVTAVEFRGYWIDIPPLKILVDTAREDIQVLLEAIDGQYPRQ